MLQLGAAPAGLVLVTVNPALRRGELAYVLLQVNAFIQPAESSLAEKEARVDAP